MVNMSKTKELLFHMPIVRNNLACAELPGIERVLCAMLLGASLQNDLGVRKHVEYVMHIMQPA